MWNIALSSSGLVSVVGHLPLFGYLIGRIFDRRYRTHDVWWVRTPSLLLNLVFFLVSGKESWLSVIYAWKFNKYVKFVKCVCVDVFVGYLPSWRMSFCIYISMSYTVCLERYSLWIAFRIDYLIKTLVIIITMFRVCVNIFDVMGFKLIENWTAFSMCIGFRQGI